MFKLSTLLWLVLVFLNALNEQAPSYDITPVGVYSVVLILGFMYIFVEHF